MTDFTILPNGLKVLSEHDAQALSVHVAIFVYAGTRHEFPAEEGLAHFLEHMAFKGTYQRTALQIAQAIEDVGGSINAYTARDHTVYHARGLSEHLPVFIEILSDILCNSVFDDADIQTERDVVLQEIAQAEDIPDDLIFDFHNDIAFPNQPLGHRALGQPEQVAAYHRDQVKGIFERFVRPGRMALVVAGRYRHDAVEELAERFLGRLPMQQNFDDEPPASPASAIAATDRNSSAQSHLLWTLPVSGLAGEQYMSWQVFANLMGGGMSSPLFQKIREERGLAYSVYAFYAGLRETGQLGFYVSTHPDRILEATTLMRMILEQVAKGDFIQDNLTRAKNQTRAAAVMNWEHAANRVDYAARRLQWHDDLRHPRELLEPIDHLNINDMRAMAEQLAANNAPVCYLLGPKAEDHLPQLERIIFG
ncbi:MAG: M16 family metallopeptidase [Alphaproteobacteria bacterium]